MRGVLLIQYMYILQDWSSERNLSLNLLSFDSGTFEFFIFEFCFSLGLLDNTPRRCPFEEKLGYTLGSVFDFPSDVY